MLLYSELPETYPIHYGAAGEAGKCTSGLNQFYRYDSTAKGTLLLENGFLEKMAIAFVKT